MRDPVFVAGSGNTYEREAIETFWRGRGPRRDPLTNQELANAAMYTNWDKRREVAAWLSRHPNRIPEGWPDRDVPPPADERGDRGRRRPATIVPRELDDLVRRPVAVAAATFAAVAAIAVAFVASTTPAGALPVPSARGAVASFDPIGVTASRGFGSSSGGPFGFRARRLATIRRRFPPPRPREIEPATPTSPRSNVSPRSRTTCVPRARFREPRPRASRTGRRAGDHRPSVGPAQSEITRRARIRRGVVRVHRRVDLRRAREGPRPRSRSSPFRSGASARTSER